MLRSHIATWIPPSSFPSLRATFATKKSHRSSKGSLDSYKRRFQPSPIQTPPETPQIFKDEPSSTNAVSYALRDTNANDNNLLAPVYVPEDPDGVLKENHPAAKILSTSAIVVQRQLELMNLTIGFEQANEYAILDPQGNHLGFIAERELGMGNVIARQMFRTHRSFETHVFDKHMREVLRFHRPFSWISSHISVYDPLEASSSSHSPSSALIRTSGSDASGAPVQVSQLTLSQMRLIGEAQQQWAPLRRKYYLSLFRQTATPEVNLSTRQTQSRDHAHPGSRQLELSQAAVEGGEGQFSQFAYVDEPFLSWDFSLLSADSRLIGSVNRNFAGFGREIFTDTGVYALRMDAVDLAEEPQHPISKTGEQKEVISENPAAGMTLDQRAIMLATAVTIDFDYFSRKSGSSGFMPIWFPFWGGSAGEAGSGVAGAEAAGSAVEGGAGAAGNLAREAASDSDRHLVVGRTGIAGYEALQRREHGNSSSSAIGQSQDSGVGSGPSQQNQGEEVWGEDSNSWSEGPSGSGGGRGGGRESGSSGGGGDGGGEGGGGGGGGGDFFDIF